MLRLRCLLGDDGERDVCIVAGLMNKVIAKIGGFPYNIEEEYYN